MYEDVPLLCSLLLGGAVLACHSSTGAFIEDRRMSSSSCPRAVRHVEKQDEPLELLINAHRASSQKLIPGFESHPETIFYLYR